MLGRLWRRSQALRLKPSYSEAQTASGYLLGYKATTCSQVPCTSTTDYACTLDGGTKRCSNGSWVY